MTVPNMTPGEYMTNMYEQLLKKLRDGEEPKNLGWLLDEAARRGDCGTVKFLLELGACPSEYAISEACIRGCLECMKLLVGARATPLPPAVLKCLLCDAVTSRHHSTEDVVRYLITELGVDPNCHAFGRTPLGHAVMTCMKPRMVMLLLSLGATIDNVVREHAKFLFRYNPKGVGQELMKALSFWDGPVHSLIKSSPEMQMPEHKWLHGAIVDIACGNFELPNALNDRITICGVLMRAINKAAAELDVDDKITVVDVNNGLMRGQFLSTTVGRLYAYATMWRRLTGGETSEPSVILRLGDRQVSPVAWGTPECIRLLAAVAGMDVMW